MENNRRIIEDPVDSGIQNIKLRTWEDYFNAIRAIGPSYIFRGQARDDWELEPSLNRLLKKHSNKNPFYSRQIYHKARFRQAIRGRRGTNPQEIENDDEL